MSANELAAAALPPYPIEVTAADIARLARVRATAVSNWRRRHADFPAAIGGNERSPHFDLEAIRRWLADHGTVLTLSDTDVLAQAIASAARHTPLRVLARDLLLAAADPPPTLLLDREQWQEHLRSGLGPGDALADTIALPHPAAAAALTAAAAAAPVQVAATLAAAFDAVPAAPDTATPTGLANLAVAACGPPGGALVDLACGNGHTAAAAAAAGWRDLVLVDVDPVAVHLAALRARGAGGPDTRVAPRAANALTLDEEPAAAAAVVHPPFADRSWDAGDPLGAQLRLPFGVPSQRDGELAWVQRALAMLGPGGTAAIVMPPAAARRASGRRIRGQLVYSGALEAVLTFPDSSLRGAAPAPMLWILRAADERGDRDRSLLFADYSAVVDHTGRPDWDRIHTTAMADLQALRTSRAPDSDRAVRIDAVRVRTDVDLSPSRYLPAPVQAAPAAVLTGGRDRAVAALRAAAAALADLPTPRDGTVPILRHASVSELELGYDLQFFTAPAQRALPADAVPVPTAAAVPDAPAPVLRVPHRGAVPTAQEEDLLVAVTGARFWARLVAPADLGALPAPGTVLVRTDPRRIDPAYLAGYLRSSAALLPAGTKSGASPLQQLRHLTIALPSLEHQVRMGEVFTALADADQALRLGASEGQATALAWHDAVVATMGTAEPEPGFTAPTRWQGPAAAPGQRRGHRR